MYIYFCALANLAGKHSNKFTIFASFSIAVYCSLDYTLSKLLLLLCRK